MRALSISKIIIIPFQIIIDFLINIKLSLTGFFPHKYPYAKFSQGLKGDIVHLGGWLESWYYMNKVLNYSNKLGYKIHILEDLPRVTKSIRNCSDILERKLVSENLSNVKLICHSKGGLVAKYFLENSSEAYRVSSVISISTPFGGTLFGIFAIFKAYELLPFSNVIKNLNNQNSSNQKFINIFPKIDTEIIPNKNKFLNNAQNIEIDVIGHTRILESDKLLNILNSVL